MADPAARQSVIVLDLSAPMASPDITDTVADAVRACFGLVSIALGVALRATADPPASAGGRRSLMSAVDVADLVVGTAWGAARLSGRLAASATRVAVPVCVALSRPPLVPRRMQPEYGARAIVDRWQRDRPEAVRSLGSWSATALPGAVTAALNQVDVERIVRIVLDHVDLDIVVAEVVQQLDLNRIVSTVTDGVDLTAAVERVLADLELDQIVATAVAGVDLDAAVSRALEHLDIDGIAAQLLARLDLTQIVLDQVDLLRIADYVIDGIDLPEIIRDSTGSVASEAVQVMRLQGAEGDVAVARAVDRLLHRRRHRRTNTLPEQAAAPSDELGEQL
jgi:hypothetical protein